MFKEHNMTVFRTGVRPVEETEKDYNYRFAHWTHSKYEKIWG